MSAPIRIGIVGSGFGARIVAPAFAATAGCEVVDVVSARDDVAVTALCARSDLDLVSVHAPPFLHEAVVGRALEARHAVLCDKPFGRSASEAARMLAAAESAGVVHLVNFEFRYEPTRVWLRDRIRDGSLGDVEQVSWMHISAGSRVPLRPHGWLFEQALGGGWIGAWGSHAIDALRWMVGEVEVLRSEPRTTITSRPDRDGRRRLCDAEDGLRAWLRVGVGATAVIDSTFAAPATLAPRVVITGTEAVAESVADRLVTVRRADGTTDNTVEEFVAPAADGDSHLVPMQRWSTVVRDAVRAGVAPEGAPTFTDGLACAVVLDALRNR